MLVKKMFLTITVTAKCCRIFPAVWQTCVLKLFLSRVNVKIFGYSILCGVSKQLKATVIRHTCFFIISLPNNCYKQLKVTKSNWKQPLYCFCFLAIAAAADVGIVVAVVNRWLYAWQVMQRSWTTIYVDIMSGMPITCVGWFVFQSFGWHAVLFD